MQTTTAWISASKILTFPWVPIPNNDELNADAAQFQPHVLQEIATCCGAASANTPAEGAPRSAGQPMKSARHPSRRGETTNPTQTLCHSFRGSCFRRKSLITVRVSLAHPTEGMRTISLRETADTACDILPIQDYSQKIIKKCRQSDVCSEVGCTGHLAFAETFTLARTAVRPASPAACGLRNQQKTSFFVGSTRPLGSGLLARRQRVEHCLFRPLSGRHA